MKSALPFSLLSLTLITSLPAEIENDLQLGFEAVTGYRSHYIYRGFELSESTLDFQLETEIVLTDDTSINLGGWYATETGSGEFDEAAGFIRLHHQVTDQFSLGLSGTYRNFNESIFREGVDVGGFGTWQFCRDFGITMGGYYDTGAEGWYGNIESNWSRSISEKTFISLQTGVSAVDSYYDRDGFNDVYGRLSLTYNISDTVSITPFVGGSALLDSDDLGDDNAFGGVWFIVRF